MPTAATHLWKPSVSRIVVIDSFIPVARGSNAVAPAPLNWAAKDPRDILDYQVDIGPALAGDPGDAIATVDIAVIPGNPGDVTVDSTVADGTRVVLWVSGGQAGVVYTVTVQVSTVNGRTVQRSILLPVVSLSDPDVPVDSIEISTGVMLTDHNGNPVLAVP